MRILLVSLLAAAVCLHLVHSLTCYSCKEVSNMDTCTKKKCQNETYCISIKGHKDASSTVLMSKQCVSECTEGPQTTLELTGNATCCKTDLCNGATSVRISCLPLVISLGFVGSLLQAGL
uniref:Lymphocyte antigen 6E-like n=1 Tax=Geotrypetes seraphini TaxID=260995 RepID=A0A6P8Q3S5_GEOSA|nr:lymphocyte antigen 6E-like [Geotrypetes seraphini]